MNARRGWILFSFVGTLIGTCTGEVDWEKHKPAICVKDKGYKVNSSGLPLPVYISLAIISMEEIDEHRMQFALQIYLQETWKDPALSLESAKIEHSEDVPYYVSQCIQTPFTIFPSVKKDEVLGGLFPNIIFNVIPGGYLSRLSRYRLTIYCQMNFKKYPMDKQACKLEITTNRKTILILNFLFTRHLASTLVNGYIPSFLIVCLSWVSFWLDPMAVPGRVTLGVTALLTLCTQIVHSRSYLPVLAYMTAMDVWLFGCLIMVFFSLIEFTFANMAARNKLKVFPQEEARRGRCWFSNEKAKIPENSPAPLKVCCSVERRCKWCKARGHSIDDISKLLFPFLMAVFSSAYWIYLLKP